MSEMLQTMREESIQARARADGSDSSIGSNFVRYMISAGELLPPWWSTSRDVELRRIYKTSDHFAGATAALAQKFAAVPIAVEPRDPTVTAHRRLAELFQILLVEGTEFGRSYFEFAIKWFIDRSTQDNGAFGEIIGDGPKDGPIKGPALGLANLDAGRCTRTGNPEYPVVYEDTDGRKYKLHHTRVIYGSDMPSSLAEMHGVGFCAESRAINNLQHLADIGVYEQEEFGSRPKRRILLTGGGLDPDDITSAIQRANLALDSKGFRRYAPVLVIGRGGLENPSLEVIDIQTAPEFFNKQDSITLGMFAIALAFNVPVRWVWPATQAGATKADAMFQHIAGLGGGLSAALLDLTYQLGGMPDAKMHMAGKFLPPSLRLVSDFQDDEQDRMVAEVREKRAAQRKTDLETQVINLRVAREQALTAGDLTDAQFEALELDSGRLPDGSDVLTLFSATDDLILSLLDLGTDEPLALDANDPADMIVEIDLAALRAQDLLANAGIANQRNRAQQALAALSKLKEMYQSILQAEIEAETVEAINQQAADAEAAGEKVPQPPSPPKDGEQEGQEDQEKPGSPAGSQKPGSQQKPGAPAAGQESDQQQKDFNFGAKVGEIIRGNLARGAGGRFVSSDQLRSSILGNLIARLRNRGKEGQASKAELKREANRAETIEAIGGRVSGNALDGMLALRGGKPLTANQALELTTTGFAETRPDGTVGLTSAGRKFMRAANSGDVDAALTAISDAAKPKAGKGGKGKKSPEQRKREREEAAAMQRAQNRAKVSDALAADVGPDLFGAFANFADGGDLDALSRTSLAQRGLVEVDRNGNPRLTVQGRKLINAADDGQVRAAKDAASEGADRVAELQERADVADQRATELDQRAMDLEADIAEQDIARMEAEAAIGELVAIGQPSAEEAAQLGVAQQRIGVMQAKLERLQEQAEAQRQLADQIRTRTGMQDSLKEMLGILKQQGRADFSAGVRSSIRGLWTGALDSFGFTDTLISALERGLTRAWNDGMASEGITPEDQTSEEKARLRELINEQIGYVIGFMHDIEGQTRAEGGKLQPLFNRGELWVKRYDQVEQEAKATAAGNKLKVWTLGQAEHCNSCLKLAGKIKRSEYWLDHGVLPRVAGAEYLTCRGYNCACTLEDSSGPGSKGPLPGLP